MAQSPSFVPSFGNRPGRLVGRDGEVAAFVDGLSQPVGHPARATMCVGQRGMGKTALLLEFSDQARRHGFVAAKATSSEALLTELIEGVQLGGSEFVPQGRKVAGASVGVLGFSAGLTFTSQTEQTATFRAKLSLLCDRLAKNEKGVCLLVDEVTPNSEQIRQLAVAYQELVGEGRNIVVALAGLPSAISNVLNDKVLTFLNRATKVRLGALPIPQITAHYAQTFQALGKSIENRDLERAAAATLGYPYLLQLVGYYLLEFAGTSAAITSDTVELAVNAARQALADTVFAPCLAPLSTRDKEFVRAMAVDSGTSSISEVARRLSVSPGSAQQTRARLIGHGLVASAGMGELEFTVPYLAEYLRDEL